jgi:dTDP-4-dehydrorhamnose 3,5-epimerase
MEPIMSERNLAEGVQVFQLQRYEDDRGWFTELARASALAKRPLQANLSFSRRGVIRGLHYHERGQDDLFICLGGSARVVVLDRESDNAVSLDIGDANPNAVYVPGHHAHGFEALADVLMLYLVTQEYDGNDPDEQVVPWNDPRVRHLWSTQSPILSKRDAAAAAY